MAGENEINEKDRYESSLLLFEQAKYLLDDEIRTTESLRNVRKTFAGLLAITVGIGLFRMDLFGKEDEILLVPVLVLWFIRISITVSIVLLAVGTMKLYSERPIFGGKKKKKDGAEDEASDRHEDPSEEGKSAAALAVLDINQEYLETLQNSAPIVVLSAKIFLLRSAFYRLSEANQRVKYQLESGKRWVLAGLFLIFFGYVVYFWVAGASLPS